MKTRPSRRASHILFLAAALLSIVPAKKSMAQWSDVVAYDMEADYPLSIAPKLHPSFDGRTLELNVQIKDFATNYAGYYLLYRVSSVDQLGKKTILSQPARMEDRSVYDEENQTPNQPPVSVLNYAAPLSVKVAHPRIAVEIFVYQVTDGLTAPSPFWERLPTVTARDGITGLNGDPFTPRLWARKVGSPVLEYAAKASRVFLSTDVSQTVNVKATTIPNLRTTAAQRRALTAKAQSAVQSYSQQALGVFKSFQIHAAPQTFWSAGSAPVGTGGLQSRVTLQGQLSSNQVASLSAKITPLFGTFNQVHPEGRVTITVTR